MDKQLFQGYPEAQRAQILRDNCNTIENIGYTKQFTADQLIDMKDRLSEVSIEANEIEIEKKEAMDGFKHRLQPFNEEKKELLSNLKNKAKYVNEDCFKMIDHESGMVGYYNSLGDLVEMRPIRQNERQTTIIPLPKAAGL